jgi:hypothetical protein
VALLKVDDDPRRGAIVLIPDSVLFPAEGTFKHISPTFGGNGVAEKVDRFHAVLSKLEIAQWTGNDLL